jgi:hypothetical protein
VLRIWIDRELVVDHAFDSSTKKFAVQDFRKGKAGEYLDVPVGGHDIEARVPWDGGDKTARTRGEFKAGATRRLRVKVGGLFKKLSTEWSPD